MPFNLCMFNKTQCVFNETQIKKTRNFLCIPHRNTKHNLLAEHQLISFTEQNILLTGNHLLTRNSFNASSDFTFLLNIKIF